MKVYLAHHYKTQERGLEIQKLLEAKGFEVINPFTRGEQARFDKAAREGMTDEIAAEIVSADLALIRDADMVFAVYEETTGTAMEIFFAAFNMLKPVVVYVAKSLGYRHPWLVTCSVNDPDSPSEDLNKCLALAEKIKADFDKPAFPAFSMESGHSSKVND